jgi:integrase/recombinase XerD
LSEGSRKRVDKVSKETATRRIDVALNLWQIERLIAAARNPRDKAFVSVLARTAIRVSEAVQLNVSDIDFKNGTLTIVHLKERARLRCSRCGETLGRKHLFCPCCGLKVEQAVRQKVEQRRRRTIPVDATTLGFITEYLEWRHHFPYRGPLLFPFTRQRGWQLIEKLGHRVGIRGLHPHSLRHWLATTWVSRGLDVRRLQLLLGHASISTTMEYVDSNLERLRSEYDQLWEASEDEKEETRDGK